MWSEANQELAQLAVDVLGPDALVAGSPLGLRAAALARQLDRGRDDRDPQEHRRRARARPPAGARMNFDFSEDQRAIKATARELLATRSPFERVREAAEAERYDAALWGELCELGWPGIAISEQHGGQGLGVVELAVLLEELGYAVAATPLLGSALAALAIERAGDDDQRVRWLPGLASGELTGAFGRPDLVADAQDAAVIVVARRRRAAADRRRGGRRRAARRDRPDAPLRARARGGRAARRRGGRGARPRRGRDRRRARRRLPARARHDGRLRQGAQAVRRAGRHVPGRRAPLRADAARHRGSALGRVLRRVGRRCRARPAGGGRRPRAGGRGRGGPQRHRVGDPGPRRHRLHVGGRRPLALQASAARRRAAGRGGVARIALARLVAGRPGVGGDAREGQLQH